MKSATVMAQASLDFCAFAQRATGIAAPTTARENAHRKNLT